MGVLACSSWACCGRGVGYGVVVLDRAGYGGRFGGFVVFFFFFGVVFGGDLWL